jgi:CRISPR system Cascade subunit CasA
MFYLFHPERPFYQVANLASRPCTEYKTPKLIGDISQSGNKARLFFSRTDSNRIESPEAARWLLHLNAFDDTSAKPSQRGGSMKSPGAGWLGKLGLVFSEGHNLFQTLLLNFVLLNADGEPFKRGTPVWELDAPRSEERVEIPQIPRDGSLAELYTMQSRRLLLTRDGGMITGYKLLGGDFFARENAFIEQMTLWRRDKKTEDFTPMRHSSDKQLWRDFSALTLKDEGSMIPGVVQWHVKLSNEGLLNGPKGTSDNIKVKFSTPSMGYGDKYFFVDDLYSDSLSINLRLLDDLRSEWRIRISDALKATGTAVWHFGNFTLNLAIAEGADPKGNNTAQIKATAQEEAYGQLDIPFREWLSSLTGNEDLDETVNEWMHMAKKILRGLATEKFNSVSDAALIGRPNDPQDLSKGFMTAFTAETIFYSGLKKSLS